MTRAVVCQDHLWAIDKNGKLKHHTWNSLWVEPHPTTKATALACSGRYVYAGTPAGSVMVYDVEGQLHKSADVSYKAISALCVSEEHDALFVGVADGTLLRQSLASLEHVVKLLKEDGRCHAKRVEAMEMSEGCLYSAGADAAILVWRVVDNRFLVDIIAGKPVTSLCGYNRHLWVGEADGTVRVLNLFVGNAMLVGERISTLAKRREHIAPVRYIVRAGKSILTAADGAESVVHWDPVRFLPTRTVNAAARGIGVMALLVRHQNAVEKSSVTVLDSNLQFSDLDFEDDSLLRNRRCTTRIINTARASHELQRNSTSTMQHHFDSRRMSRISTDSKDSDISSHENNIDANATDLAVDLANGKKFLTKALDGAALEPTNDVTLLFGATVRRAIQSVEEAEPMAASIDHDRERGSPSDRETPSEERDGESKLDELTRTVETLNSLTATLNARVSNLELLQANKNKVNATWIAAFTLLGAMLAYCMNLQMTLP